MLTPFEEFTDELNEYERKVLLPIMVACFEKHVGEEDAIRAVKEALIDQREVMREQIEKRQPAA